MIRPQVELQPAGISRFKKFFPEISPHVKSILFIKQAG